MQAMGFSAEEFLVLVTLWAMEVARKISVLIRLKVARVIRDN